MTDAAQLRPTLGRRLGQSLLAGSSIVVILLASAQAPHPPAAGFALGLVLEYWDLRTVLLMVAAVLLLSGLRLALRRWLIDLA